MTFFIHLYKQLTSINSTLYQRLQMFKKDDSLNNQELNINFLAECELIFGVTQKDASPQILFSDNNQLLKQLTIIARVF